MARIELRMKINLPKGLYQLVPVIYSMLCVGGAALWALNASMAAGLTAVVAGWRALQITHMRGLL